MDIFSDVLLGFQDGEEFRVGDDVCGHFYLYRTLAHHRRLMEVSTALTLTYSQTSISRRNEGK